MPEGEWRGWEPEGERSLIDSRQWASAASLAFLRLEDNEGTVMIRRRRAHRQCGLEIPIYRVHLVRGA